MIDDRATAARIEALEIRVAHQEKAIADLNEVITAQWRKIETLAREFGRLSEEVQNAETTRDAPEPPPPHY